MGFIISGLQALNGDIRAPIDSVDGICTVLEEKLGQQKRLTKAAIQAFISSTNFYEAKVSFNRLSKLKTLAEADI